MGAFSDVIQTRVSAGIACRGCFDMVSSVELGPLLLLVCSFSL